MATPLERHELEALVSDLINDRAFLLRDAELRARRALCFQQRPVVIPGIPLRTEYRSPIIEDAATKYKNRMLAAPINIDVAATGEGPRATDKARNMGAYFRRSYEYWRKNHAFDGNLFNMAAFGFGCVHLGLNREIMPLEAMAADEDPEAFLSRAKDKLDAFSKGEHPDLFIIDDIQPQTLYWTPDKTLYVQAAQVPVNPLARIHGLAGEFQSRDEEGNERWVTVTTSQPGVNVRETPPYTSTVTLYRVEDKDFIYHLLLSRQGERKGAVEAKPLGVYKNIFGRPCFFVTPGEYTGDASPLFQYRPLTNGLYQIVPQINIFGTARCSAGVQAAQERMTLKWIGQGTPPPLDEAALEIRVMNDGVLVPPDGYEIVVPQIQMGIDLDQALKFSFEEAGRFDFPVSLSRPQDVTAQSGYDRARQQDAVSSLLDPPLSNWATTLKELFQALATGIRTLDIPVTIRNIRTVSATAPVPVPVEQKLTLNPGDIVDFDIDVSFNAVTLFSQIAQQEEGIKLLQQDLVNETEFLRDFRGIDDVGLWRDQRLLDKAQKLADEAAVQDVGQALASIRDLIMQQGAEESGVQTKLTALQASSPSPSDIARPDRGPSMPVGPGQAEPLQPTPPGQAEMGGPAVQAGSQA